MHIIDVILYAQSDKENVKRKKKIFCLIHIIVVCLRERDRTREGEYEKWNRTKTQIWKKSKKQIEREN